MMMGDASTPKLCLSKLPGKPRQQPKIETPPINLPVSIPFRWEEAPGKPRPIETPTKSSGLARCLELDLPPKLLFNDIDDITIIPPFPMTINRPRPVLVTNGSALPKWLINTLKTMVRLKKSGGSRIFVSDRWGSFFKDEKLMRGTLDIEHLSNGMFQKEEIVKFTNIRRTRSLFHLFKDTSNL